MAFESRGEEMRTWVKAAQALKKTMKIFVPDLVARGSEADNRNHIIISCKEANLPQ